jgi:hypothetical protein
MCKKSSEDASKKGRKNATSEIELRESVNNSSVGDDEVNCAGSSKPQKLGPISTWTYHINPKLTEAEALH